jgi:hypothetical protein
MTMFPTMLTLSALLAVPLGTQGAPAPTTATTLVRPLAGDAPHGDALLQEAKAKPRVDGAWLNSYSDAQIVARLRSGKEGFPEIETENVLDLYDVVAALRARNTDLRDLVGTSTHVLPSRTVLDEPAAVRLRDRAGIKTVTVDEKQRVFAVYKLPDAQGLTWVDERDSKTRDRLKRNTKTGYVVFVPFELRGATYEAAFAVDKDIHITSVALRGPDGSVDAELALAASRFVGKGTRGNYDALKAGGAGKAVNELAKPLSDAFLRGMEHVYMFEVAERDYFAFSD